MSILDSNGNPIERPEKEGKHSIGKATKAVLGAVVLTIASVAAVIGNIESIVTTTGKWFAAEELKANPGITIKREQQKPSKANHDHKTSPRVLVPVTYLGRKGPYKDLIRSL